MVSLSVPKNAAMWIGWRRKISLREGTGPFRSLAILEHGATIVRQRHAVKGYFPISNTRVCPRLACLTTPLRSRQMSGKFLPDGRCGSASWFWHHIMISNDGIARGPMRFSQCSGCFDCATHGN